MREASRRERKQQPQQPAAQPAPSPQPTQPKVQAPQVPAAQPQIAQPAARKGSYLEIIGPHEKPLAVQDMEKREARRKRRLAAATRWYWENKEWVRRRNAERTRYLRDMDKATKEAWDKLQKDQGPDNKAAGQPDGVSRLPGAAKDKPKPVDDKA